MLFILLCGINLKLTDFVIVHHRDTEKVVKTYWCEDFEKVTGGCPVPVVMAGGPRVETEKEVFGFVCDGMQKGAIGVNLGRNIWQHKYPVAMIKALQAVIHKQATAKEAVEIFNQTKDKKN